MEGCEVSLGLGLGLGTSVVSKTIAEFVTRLSSIGNLQKRMMKLDEYVKSLEDEMRKIDAFKRELPLCMFLLTDAIEYLKEQSKRWCSNKRPRPEPALKEISLMEKKKNKGGDEEEVLNQRPVLKDGVDEKRKWMSSFQLCNTDLNLSSGSTKQTVEAERSEPKPVVIEQNVAEMPKFKMGGLFQTFETGNTKEVSRLLPVKESRVPATGVLFMEERKAQPVLPRIPPVPELSLVTPTASNLIQRPEASDVKGRSFVREVVPSHSASVQVSSRSVMQMPHQPFSRKQRRCWSPELHRAFVIALQQLGGPQVATPKQIRDHMQVDGLTNDEVKSHLQKYRLHVRKLPNKPNDASANESTVILGDFSNNQDHCKDDSESGSPTGPLDLDLHQTGGDNMEADDDEQYSSYD